MRFWLRRKRRALEFRWHYWRLGYGRNYKGPKIDAH